MSGAEPGGARRAESLLASRKKKLVCKRKSYIVYVRKNKEEG